MPSEVTGKLLDIGEALGADAVKYIRARRLFEEFEEIATDETHPKSLAAQHIIDALNLLHMAICGKTAVNPDETEL